MVISLKNKKACYCRDLCKAWCCKHLVTFLDRSDEKDIDIFFKLRGIEYNSETKQMIIPCKCKWLNNHNKCKRYSFRPYSCRVYECDTLKNMIADS